MLGVLRRKFNLQGDPDDGMVLLFLDISRAHPHVPMKRTLCIELPPEHAEHHNGAKGGLLLSHLYEVRDASQNFELKVETTKSRRSW